MKASVPAPKTRRPARPWSLSARRLSDLGPVNKAILEVAFRGVVWVVAWDLSAEAWTTWIVFMGHGYAYFSPIITNHLDHFHLYFPLRIPFSGLPEIEIDL